MTLEHGLVDELIAVENTRTGAEIQCLNYEREVVLDNNKWDGNLNLLVQSGKLFPNFCVRSSNSRVSMDFYVGDRLIGDGVTMRWSNLMSNFFKFSKRKSNQLISLASASQFTNTLYPNHLLVRHLVSIWEKIGGFNLTNFVKAASACHHKYSSFP